MGQRAGWRILIRAGVFGIRESRTAFREKIPGLVPVLDEKTLATLLFSIENRGLSKRTKFQMLGARLAYAEDGALRQPESRWPGAIFAGPMREAVSAPPRVEPNQHESEEKDNVRKL